MTTINLGIDLEKTFVLDEAVDIVHAAKLMRGRGGKAPSVETVRRFANPDKGCRPQGDLGPKLVLPSVRLNGQRLFMPQWVERFERERVRLGMTSGGADRPVLPRTPKKRQKAHEQAKAVLRKAGVTR